MSVSSCRYCMFVSCVPAVAGLYAAFCMTCSLLILVEDAIGNHMEVVMNVSFCLFHLIVGSDFIICSVLCACTEML